MQRVEMNDEERLQKIENIFEENLEWRYLLKEDMQDA